MNEDTSPTAARASAPKPVLQTASFSTYTGPGRISIARFAPRGTPAGFRIFKALAPGAWFNSVTWDEYCRLFAREILGHLDPQQTLEQLQALAGPDAIPTLLCWEKPPFEGENQCHRRLVAAWFGEKLGLDVPELDAAPVLPASGATRLKRGQVSLKPGVGPDPEAIK